MVEKAGVELSCYYHTLKWENVQTANNRCTQWGRKGLSPSPSALNDDNPRFTLSLFGWRAIVAGRLQLGEPFFDGGQLFGILSYGNDECIYEPVPWYWRKPRCQSQVAINTHMTLVICINSVLHCNSDSVYKTLHFPFSFCCWIHN